MTSLVVLVPTRGRPGNARRLLAACAESCVLPDTRIRFGVDIDDPTLADYEEIVRTARAPKRASVLVCQPPPRRGMVYGLNQMWRWDPDAADVFGFLGDDHVPRTVGWDKSLCEAVEGKPAAVAYGNDLFQGERIPTAVGMTAAIPRALGYLAPPALRHLYVDNVWADWGRGLGALTYLPHVVIEHLHPAASKAPLDPGYEVVNAPDADATDRAAYLDYRDGGRLAADLEKLRALP